MLVNYIANRQECLGATSGFVRGAAPPPPSLQIDYIVVGGGGVSGTATGGSGGGVVSGSSAIAWNSTLGITVGLGGTSSPYTNGASSSISGTLFGVQGAGGATFNKSGGPQYFNAGLSGPGNTSGGGAGSSKNGNSGVAGQNGDGGTGSVWLNGLYYAGGGGGVQDPALPSSAGYPGLGGGGTALTGSGPDGLPYQINGYNGRGGGAAGNGTSGGSGVVIIRYPNTVTRMGQGGTQFESGGFFYHEFTSSGQFTYQFQ